MAIFGEVSIKMNLDTSEMQAALRRIQEQCEDAWQNGIAANIFMWRVVGKIAVAELRLFGFSFKYERAGAVKSFNIRAPKPLRVIREWMTNNNPNRYAKCKPFTFAGKVRHDVEIHLNGRKVDPETHAGNPFEADVAEGWVKCYAIKFYEDGRYSKVMRRNFFGEMVPKVIRLRGKVEVYLGDGRKVA